MNIGLTHTYNPTTHKLVLKDAVVLDLGDEAKARQLVTFLREIIGHWPYGVLHYHGGHYDLSLIADQIEAQTRPPRIPEPGLWGVVEAGVKEHGERLRWVRLSGGNFRADDSDEYDRTWEDLVDPVLIRGGVQ